MELHPLDLAWLSGLAPDARILDYGCGYGRVVGQLYEDWFVHAEGVDLSAALIDRAREAWPQLRFSVLDDPPALPHPDDSLDAALLFAVLTCIPGDEGQRRLVAELHRVLRPGGLIYLSDMCLQQDERNQARYRAFAAQYGTYGVFETGDGAVVITTADHMQTRTRGPRGVKTKAAEQGRPLEESLGKDINEMLDIGQRQYGDARHYVPGILQMLNYHVRMGRIL